MYFFLSFQMCDFLQEIVETRIQVKRFKFLAKFYGTNPEIVGVPNDENRNLMLLINNFFNSIMDKTNTIIRHLVNFDETKDKRSRVTVYIRGFPERVSAAIRLIRSETNLEMTLKIDLSWFQHPYILGKAGYRIQQIMNHRDLNIHFPDTNLNPDNGLSNGDRIYTFFSNIEDVENARSDIRMMTPLTYKFRLPYSPSTSRLKIANKYIVNFKLIEDQNNSPLIEFLVKGSVWDAQNVKAAVYNLIHEFCGPSASEVNVHTSLEMRLQDKQSIFGRDSEILKKIMQETSTTIKLLEEPALKIATISIRGSVESVDLARQNIIGRSPVTFKFPLIENTYVSHIEINELKQALDVDITTPIDKNGQRLVYIKSTENNIGNVYKAW